MHLYNTLGQKLRAQDVDPTITARAVLEEDKALASRKDITGQLHWDVDHGVQAERGMS